MYLVLLTTGLRKGELASLTVGQIEQSASVTYVSVNPEDAKNRKGASIPLRGDVADALAGWLRERLRQVQDDCRTRHAAIPACLDPSERLFNVPGGLSRILDRDLAAANIPKRDGRNRVVDVHALRHTFGSHLCASGVPLRTAQAAMRHSKPELTANIYVDPQLLDLVGAVESLPRFGTTTGSRQAATGTP